MNEQQQGIRVGLVAAFKGAQTILLIGDGPSLEWLANELKSRHPVVLTCDPGSEVELLMFLPSEGKGRCFRSGVFFTWHMSQDEAQRVAAQLVVLAACGKPAHAFLDADVTTPDLQIMASVDEYDPDRVFLGNDA